MGSFFAPTAIKAFTGVSVVLLIAVAVLWFRAEAATAKRALAEERLEAALGTINDLSVDLGIMWNAGAERAADEQRIDQQRKELADATRVPSDSPDMRDLRAMCVLARQQRRIDRLPAACGRFEDETGARPRR